MSGAAVQCYNKATEATAYLLDNELLVREAFSLFLLVWKVASDFDLGTLGLQDQHKFLATVSIF